MNSRRLSLLLITVFIMSFMLGSCSSSAQKAEQSTIPSTESETTTTVEEATTTGPEEEGAPLSSLTFIGHATVNIPIHDYDHSADHVLYNDFQPEGRLIMEYGSTILLEDYC